VRTGIIVTAALLASSQGATAQVITTGGQIQQIPPAPVAPKPAPDLQLAPRAPAPDSGPAGAPIQVNALHITGATLFPEPVLIAAGGFTPGSSLTLRDLRGIAARISAYYNRRGYFLAQAYLPEQDIKDGVVTIAVIEGRYGKVGIQNHTNLSPRVANGVLAGLDRNDVVTNAPLERRLLLLSDIPGVTVHSTLAPGSEVGTTDLLVDLAPSPRITGSLEADNAGNRYTGTYRFGGSVNLNDPTGLGDMVSLRILASTEGLAYGRAAYQVPIGNLTVGVAYAHFRYDLSHEFEALDAHGKADIISAFASYPLIRSRSANLYAVAAFDVKKFVDDVDLTQSESDRRSRVVTLGLNADWRDRSGAATTASIGWSIGNLNIESPVERAVDDITAHSNGGFNKILFSLGRLQHIAGPLSLYGAVRGQMAFDNLDSSEKMELGGAYGVRAYPEGEAYGDQGYIATAEARLRLSPRGVPGQFQVIGFVDVGQVDYAHTPWFTGSNSAHRSGIGGGLSWAGPERILISGTYATRLGDNPVTSQPDRAGRFWFQIVKLF